MKRYGPICTTESPKQAGGLGMADGHGPYVGPTPINKLLIAVSIEFYVN